jgi:hypothetical protein
VGFLFHFSCSLPHLEQIGSYARHFVDQLLAERENSGSAAAIIIRHFNRQRKKDETSVS